MNTLVKSIASTTIGLAIATTSASATQSNNADTRMTNYANTIELNSQIAQQSPFSSLNETRSRRFVDEMIMLRMKMVEAAESALQSPNPEIKRMAQETIKTSNTEIKKMMEMRGKFGIYEDG
ncbi:MAG: hypothetical protein N4J56_004356 [Chroococcidiopsis sp. SAG 2025]|uniref:hypothetical protein n=1 Tax=Chroococcidiopsis sp. SAG 2025 TaxID=171389 RepID=UPI00293719B5|nr:hypothetical protein [Chroococcidiopsis sp. SAG 2025]MDV2994702.1 hypothetical protein [Chroococcidiopsis sp. SAG 2025]